MGSDYRVLQQAAEWFALLQSGSVSASERRAWAAWLEQPEHAQAWAKVERISGQFQPLTSDAIGRAAGAMLQQRQSTRRQALKVLSVLCGGAVLTVAGGALPWRRWAADERTAVGEVRDLRPADGTRLWLNTDSALDVRFDAKERRLALQHGELLIDAPASRRGRPLVLSSREGMCAASKPRAFAAPEEGRTRLSVFAGVVDIQLEGFGVTSVPAGQQAAFDRRHVGPLAAARAPSTRLGDRGAAGRQPASRGLPRRTVALSPRLPRLRSTDRRSACGRGVPAGRYRPCTASPCRYVACAHRAAHGLVGQPEPLPKQAGV